MFQVVESINISVNSNKSVDDKVSEISNALYSSASNCKIDSVRTELMNVFCQPICLLNVKGCMKYLSLSTSVFFEHFKSLHCPNQLELYIIEDEVKDFMDNYIKNDAVYLELDQPFTNLWFRPCKVCMTILQKGLRVKVVTQ